MTNDGIKSGDKLFRIVHTFLDLGTAGVTELADEMELPKSTVHEHLQTLEYHGYAVKTDDGYRLGLRFLNVGARLRNMVDVYQAAKSQVRDLATKTGAHAGLIVEENGRGILLESSGSVDASDLPFDEFAGIRMAMHATASGKAILAQIGQEQVNTIIDRHGLTRLTDETITDRERLYEELVEIRQKGFAVSSGESIEGLYSIAAPITDMNGDTHGALTVYGPFGTLQEPFIEETSHAVIQASKVCEMNLNHTMQQ
jgi:DNA-binding IclR family transcriptional regulator